MVVVCGKRSNLDLLGLTAPGIDADRETMIVRLVAALDVPVSLEAMFENGEFVAEERVFGKNRKLAAKWLHKVDNSLEQHRHLVKNLTVCIVAPVAVMVDDVVGA